MRLVSVLTVVGSRTPPCVPCPQAFPPGFRHLPLAWPVLKPVDDKALRRGPVLGIHTRGKASLGARRLVRSRNVFSALWRLPARRDPWAGQDARASLSLPSPSTPVSLSR